MVLDDANAQSLVDQLASGNTLDLMNQLSSTTLAGGGAYSPYVGAIVDTAQDPGSLHTAHFQYIPALALPTERHTESAAEYAALVPQPEVRGGGGAAAHRAAAGRRRCIR